MTNNPVADLVRNALDFANLMAGEGIEIDGISPEDFLMEYSVATGDEDWDTLPDRILAALTQTSAEPVVCRTCQDFGWLEHALQKCPDCARPATMTVEAAAQVLLDQPYDVMAKAFEAMDRHQGEGADRIMSAALRALAAKGGQHE